MEDYEKMLNSAFEKVKSCEECGRFEIKKANWNVQGKKTFINNFMQISNCLRKGGEEQFAKFLSKELEDLKKSAESLQILIKELLEKLDVEFKQGIEKINKTFHEFFVLMFGGGEARLEVVKEKIKRRKALFVHVLFVGFFESLMNAVTENQALPLSARQLQDVII